MIAGLYPCLLIPVSLSILDLSLFISCLCYFLACTVISGWLPDLVRVTLMDGRFCCLPLSAVGLGSGMQLVTWNQFDPFETCFYALLGWIHSNL